MKILAFDPGVGKMGWALLEVNLPNPKVTVLGHGTLTGSHYLKTYEKSLRKKFKENFLILLAYSDAVTNLIQTHQPDIVVSEGAFAHKRPQAAFSLVKCIHVIRLASYHQLKKDVAIVAPMLTKKTLTGNHIAQKEEVQSAIIKNKNIRIPKDRSTFSEHTYDAVGHGYHYIQTLLYPDKYYLTKPKKKK